MLSGVDAVGIPSVVVVKLGSGLHPRRSVSASVLSTGPSMPAMVGGVPFLPTIRPVSSVLLRLVIAVSGRRPRIKVRSRAASVIVVLGVSVAVASHGEHAWGAACGIVAVPISVIASSPVPISLRLWAVQRWPAIGPIDGRFEATNRVQRSLPPTTRGVGFIGFGYEFCVNEFGLDHWVR